MLMLVSLVPVAAFAADNPFTDVPEENNPFFEAIMWAVEKGITAGYSDNTFRPSATCTRGHVVTFLWRAAGQPEPKSMENKFSDVDPGSPFFKAILWAAEQNITTGYADGTFRPNDACTRAHVVTFLWRYDNKPEASGTVSLSDLAGLNADFTAAIKWAATNNITTGYADGTFRPSAVCTRAHVVTFLYRDTNGKTPVGPVDPPQPQGKYVYLMSEKATQDGETTVWTYSHDQFGNVVSGVAKDKSGNQIGEMTETYFSAENHSPKEIVRKLNGDTTTTVYDEKLGLILAETVITAQDTLLSRVENVYTAEGLLAKSVSVDNEIGGTTTDVFTYDAEGKLVKDVMSTTYLDGTSDEITTEYTYKDGKLAEQKIFGTDSEGGEYTALAKCSYDSAGNEIKRSTTFSMPGASNYSLEFTFSYDSAGNLTKQVQKMSGAGILIPVTIFSYSYSYKQFGDQYYKTKESVSSPLASSESYTIEYTYEYK